jgi:hypothetical protein
MRSGSVMVRAQLEADLKEAVLAGDTEASWTPACRAGLQ